MNELGISDLTFPMVTLGEAETPWNLCPLLYFGGAEAKANEAADLITQGALGSPIVERLKLVESLHDVISGKLAGGGSKETARSEIWILRNFFSWAEQEGQSLSIASVESTYIHWAEFLWHREKVVSDIKKGSSYPRAKQLLHWIMDRVIKERQAKAFLLESGIKDLLIDFLYDERVLHVLRKGISAKDSPGVRFNVYGIDYGCYVDLINTVNAPKGILDLGDEDHELFIATVPSTDLRSIRRCVLDLPEFYAQVLHEGLAA